MQAQCMSLAIEYVVPGMVMQLVTETQPSPRSVALETLRKWHATEGKEDEVAAGEAEVRMIYI